MGKDLEVGLLDLLLEEILLIEEEQDRPATQHIRLQAGGCRLETETQRSAGWMRRFAA